tara:strand:+ start:49 stop:423 length:375 start_codon:yes stop_codon:yes gene_type:complete
MNWKSKRKHYGKNANYSISKKLRKENKTTIEFEIMLNNLSLEEAIGLKLELASRVAGSKLYGFNIWQTLPEIIKDAVLKYAMSSTRTKAESMRFLGLNVSMYKKLLKKYEIDSYFEENSLTENA